MIGQGVKIRMPRRGQYSRAADISEHGEVPVNPSYREFLNHEVSERWKNVVVQPSSIEP